MQNVEALEAGFPAPAPEVRACEIEGVAELDQHIQGHQQPKDVLASVVVDQVLDGNQRTAVRQGRVSRPDQMLLLLEVPVVEDPTLVVKKGSKI